jgi:hypothetical protein
MRLDETTATPVRPGPRLETRGPQVLETFVHGQEPPGIRRHGLKTLAPLRPSPRLQTGEVSVERFPELAHRLIRRIAGVMLAPPFRQEPAGLLDDRRVRPQGDRSLDRSAIATDPNAQREVDR